MNCERFEELITPYLDGDLSGGGASAFRAHQLSCPDCRTLLADIAEALEAVGEMPEVEPPLGLMSRALVIPALNPAMNCERFADLVTEFLDGFLEASVYHAFEDHAKECDGCSEVLSGVALAVSACHSVHFSEQLDVPDSLVASILAETTGAAPAKAEAERGFWGRLIAALPLSAGVRRAPRFATASAIVLMFSVLVADGVLAPASLYENAARLTSRVYSRSADFAAKTDEVLSEVKKVSDGVGEILNEPETRQDGTAAPKPAESRDTSSRKTPATLG
jgi:anti-sigma factor RsiW